MLYNQLKKCIDEYTKIKHVLTVNEGNGGHAGNGGQQELVSKLTVLFITNLHQHC